MYFMHDQGRNYRRLIGGGGVHIHIVGSARRISFVKVNCLQKKLVGHNRIYEYAPPPLPPIKRVVTALSA